MSHPAISVRNLGKRYTLGVARRSDTLRERIPQLGRDLLGMFKRGSAQADAGDRADQFWALRNVGFDVNPGEVVGIIGRNGAGKSTLLKILSQITGPTEGEVRVRGRMASLLEVGTGFHPELTGRENVFLNGAILGMSRTEILKKFDEIVAFAEVEKFLDTPVKRYSSGMYVRLAFAVAAHLEPDILVIDEVLAVGDGQFQKKCLGKIEDVAGEGRTVLFVSHNMAAIQSLCRRAIWISSGSVEMDGTPNEVVGTYLTRLRTGIHSDILAKSHDGSFQITKVLTLDGQGEEATCFRPGSAMTVVVRYKAAKPIQRPHFWIAVVNRWGSLFSANMMLDDIRPSLVEGEGEIRCRFRSMPLLPNQTYTITFGAREPDGTTSLLQCTEVAYFEVVGAAREAGLNGPLADFNAADSTPIVLEYQWHFPNETTPRPVVKINEGSRP